MEPKYGNSLLLLLLLALSSCWCKSLRSEDGQRTDIERKLRDGRPVVGQAHPLLRSGPKDVLAPGPSDVDPSVTKEERGKAPKVSTIVGGEVLTPNSLPFLVHIANVSSGEDKPLCGGIIIDTKHILTAAHCFIDLKDGDRIRITAAEHKLDETEGPEQHEPVQKMFIHDKFDEDVGLYDIAMLRLTHPLTFNVYVSAAVLNEDGSCPSVGDNCSVAGWGRTSHGGPFSDVPKTVDMQVQRQTICERIYGKTNFGDNQICAAAPDAGPCLGDSGGPLVCTCGGARVVAGITSFGRECGSEDPHVFTRVSGYSTWITDAIRSP